MQAGKVVKVKGHVIRTGKPVIEVVSAFLYRGRFTDYENMFETTEEPDYVVTLESDAAVGVLQSKEWIDESKPLLAGTSLILHVKSQVSFKDKTADIFVRNQLKALVLVGSVNFQQDYCSGNPVVACIHRHGIPQGLSTPLANEGYTLANTAATRHYVENIVAKGHPDHVLVYNVSFVRMVLPGDELSVKMRHVGMRVGNIVFNIVTSNTRGEKVLEGSAKVTQPTTICVFTGRGSQEAGMGMDLYNSSPAAQAPTLISSPYTASCQG
ncbi:hypothetical protein B0H11DRAFT_2428489 [Mycena galericulata]|nr:hypothetical protein B0H11DRAFT_2428489 [Mycena galericulata]